MGAVKRVILIGITLSLILPATGESNFSVFQTGTGFVPACDVTKNINTDFGAVGNGIADDSASFTGVGSFLDFAINTYQPANPGKTICLSANSGNRYLFGVGAFPLTIFDGVTNLVFNANGAAMTNALNLTAVSGAAGQKVITFASVPASVTVGMLVIDDTNSTAIDGQTQSVASKTATTVTLNVNIAAPGVTAGDIISFKGGGFAFGTKGQPNDAAHIATVVTVAAGATSVTLTDPTQTSKFTVNTWNVITGANTQGGGDPINMLFHEFVFVTAIDSTPASPTYGKITFQSPLKFGYKSTWPGDGAASLRVMPPSWNVSQFYNNVTAFGWDGLGNTVLNTNGRSITFNNPSFPGQFGFNVSQIQTLIVNNPSMPNIGFWEFDKLWEAANINGGTLDGLNFFGGTANDTLTLTGTHVKRAVIGTPGYFNIVNSTLDGGMKPGATAFGYTTSISCLNSNLGSGLFDFSGAIDPSITNANGVTINTSGLMTIPHTVVGLPTWAVPGAEMYFGTATTKYGVPFLVTDITGDASNTYVQTNLTGYTSLPGQEVRSAWAKTINFVNCTGSPSVLDVSQAGAQNARPMTYSNRIYTCTNGIAAQQALHPGVPVIDLNTPPSTDPRLARAISSFTVAVSQAEAGSAVTWHLGGQFDNGTVFDSAGASSVWAPIVNLNLTGTRTYTGATNTWSGGQGGDTLSTTTPGFPSYLGGTFGFSPAASRSVSGESAGSCPIVTLTIQTSYLMRRDLDPAANDNEPTLREKVA